VTLNEIYNDEIFILAGRDEAEKIKYFIKNAYETWGTKYVLLVGGSEELPIRKSHIYISDFNEAEIFSSDLYYADIYDSYGKFSSWDSNNNNIFGEYKFGTPPKTDKIDLYPDVHLGRIPSKTIKDVANVVNKIIEYETCNSEDTTWFNRVIVCGGDTYPTESTPMKAINEGDYINQKILDIVDNARSGRNFIGVKLWPDMGTLNDEKMKEEFSKGAGFIEFSGHGRQTLWRNHPHNAVSWLPDAYGFNNEDIETIGNDGKYPIVIIGACNCSQFDFTEPCLAWKFIKQPNCGGIASIGSTGYSYMGVGDFNDNSIPDCIEYYGGLMEIEAFRAYVGGAKCFGELWSESITQYINKNGGVRKLEDVDYVTIEEWQPFGDPTLQLKNLGDSSDDSTKPNKPNDIELESGDLPPKVGHSYLFKTSTIDLDNDEVYYLFDWGDGTDTGYLGPYYSGECCNFDHVWKAPGLYNIKAKAIDVHGCESEWSDTYQFNIKKSRSYEKIYSNLIESIKSFFPNFFNFLKILIEKQD
jgi:hypothetical protein